MLAGVFPWGVHHIEHSGNPLGHLSILVVFDGHNRQKQVIVAFLSFPSSPPPPHPCPSHM